MTKAMRRRVQAIVRKNEIAKGLRKPPRIRTDRRVLTEDERTERRIRAEKNRLDRLMGRIRTRELNNDYIETLEAMEAKRDSEEPGRYGRGESAIDQYVTHGVVEADRQYHGYRNIRDDQDDGDTDAWRHAD